MPDHAPPRIRPLTIRHMMQLELENEQLRKAVAERDELIANWGKPLYGETAFSLLVKERDGLRIELAETKSTGIKMIRVLNGDTP